MKTFPNLCLKRGREEKEGKIIFSNVLTWKGRKRGSGEEIVFEGATFLMLKYFK